MALSPCRIVACDDLLSFGVHEGVFLGALQIDKNILCCVFALTVLPFCALLLTQRLLALSNLLRFGLSLKSY